MKERPILFSGPMILALLNGTKTQTRRVVKPQPYIDEQGNFCWNGSNFGQDGKGPHTQAIASPIPSSKTKRIHCPYGQPGDRLWVRETWAAHWMYDDVPPVRARSECEYLRPGDNRWFAADGDYSESQLGNMPYGLRGRWRPSIHMPRWASRIALEITSVRVERLQRISEADAIAEGIAPFTDFHPTDHWRRYDKGTFNSYCGPIESFASLFESLNGPQSWEFNPWVWVIEFKRVEGCTS